VYSYGWEDLMLASPQLSVQLWLLPLCDPQLSVQLWSWLPYPMLPSS